MEKTIEELIDMYRAGKLHTDQTTQRNFIYNDMMIRREDGDVSKAGDVIKSILERGIQLPAIYFWNVQDPASGEFYAEDEFNIHDGKQRFMSIYNFVEGLVVTKINGIEYKFGNLDEKLQDKLLDYKLDIVVRTGTKKEEEQSFFYINTTGVPLTDYEGLKGAYHGRYLDEFENYIDNLNMDGIKNIGRGEQAIWLLYVALGLIDEDKKLLVKKAQDKLQICRENSFDETLGKFNEKVKFYAELIKMGVTGKNIDKNPQKMCQIANYTINHRYDTAEVYGYYAVGLKKDNDIEKWKFNTHKTAIDNLFATPQVKCDYRRFFDTNMKSVLYRKSPKCGKCGKVYNFDELEVDHIIAWSNGGRTDEANAQLLCKSCNCSKGGIN